MDDFINKVGFGLNVVFGNGVGYPTTNWLILDGAKDEQKFKYVLAPSSVAHRSLVQRISRADGIRSPPEFADPARSGEAVDERQRGPAVAATDLITVGRSCY